MNEKFKRLTAAFERASKALHFARKSCKHNVRKVKWYNIEYAQCIECDSYVAPWDIYISGGNKRKPRVRPRRRVRPSEMLKKLRNK